MISIDVGSVPAEFPQKKDVIADSGAQGPMSQQDAVALTAMKCIRKNLCNWLAVVIQMQESMKERIVCIRSLRRDRRSADGALPQWRNCIACVNANLVLRLRSPMAKAAS